MTLIITFTFLLGDIDAVKHNLNSCQRSYPIIMIMCKSFAMEAQADATLCCIIVIIKHEGITPPNISTALDFLKNVC